ncbi:MAG TPA: TetR/AcrR family transcriptional regulator [Streptosporangiaceae bacterium]|jgi:AcrR family transcriptional regulator
MSPRKPAILRDGDGQNLREYLIATAARLIDERGSAGLSVRDIAREAQVADGVLYNYFEDKEDLLAHALLAHVGTVMNSAPRLPPPGTGTVAENLRLFIDAGLATLTRVVPAFAGLISQPNVLKRFHAMVGGDAAFAGEAATGGGQKAAGDGVAQGGQTGGGAAESKAGPGRGGPPDDHNGGGQAGLPAILATYLRAEQRLGRIDEAADIEAAVTLVVGAIHGQILPRVLFSPPGSPVTAPPGLAGRLAATVLSGIAPVSPLP